MPHFHPWRWLRARPNIDLTWSREIAEMGTTDGLARIVLHPDQLQVERRCTLAHELAHIELGHTRGCHPWDETQARQYAARWLITMDRLLDVLSWTNDLDEAADELWVDEETLRDRLDGLSEIERAMIVRRYMEVERGV